MMSVPLRILLVAGSILTMLFILYRIRVSKMLIKDSIFWIFFSLILIVISVFPGIAIWFSMLLGFSAPINFIFICIIFLMLIQLFSCNLRISKLDAELKHLCQRQAIDKKEKSDKEQQ